MVTRSVTVFSAYHSTDGNIWTLVSGSSVSISMTGSVLAGLAVTSHNSNALGTVVFDTVKVNAGGIPVTCPTAWTCADIGSPALPGSQSLNGSTWTIQAGGTDIFGTADQFHFVSQSLAADGGVKAHVTSQTNTSSWAKAGVMLRQNNTAGSQYYFALVTPGNGIVIQYRATQGGNAQTLVTLTGTVPAYLEVTRVGTTFTAYTSTDGVTWTAVAGSSITINITGAVLAGLAATTQNSNAACPVIYGTGIYGNT